MKVFCVKEGQHTPNVPGSERVKTTKNNRKYLLVTCANCGITKSRFLSDKQALELEQKGAGVLDKPLDAIKFAKTLTKKNDSFHKTCIRSVLER